MRGWRLREQGSRPRSLEGYSEGSGRVVCARALHVDLVGVRLLGLCSLCDVRPYWRVGVADARVQCAAARVCDSDRRRLATRHEKFHDVGVSVCRLRAWRCASSRSFRCCGVVVRGSSARHAQEPRMMHYN